MMNKQVINLKDFDIAVLKSGIRVWDKRHKPTMFCGKLTWQELMDIVQSECEPPTIIP